MKFKKGMYIDEKSLTKDEAIEFVDFLRRERERHREELRKFKDVSMDDGITGFFRILALTVVVRHIDDIEHTDRTIDYLVKKYGDI